MYRFVCINPRYTEYIDKIRVCIGSQPNTVIDYADMAEEKKDTEEKETPWKKDRRNTTPVTCVIPGWRRPDQTITYVDEFRDIERDIIEGKGAFPFSVVIGGNHMYTVHMRIINLLIDYLSSNTDDRAVMLTLRGEYGCNSFKRRFMEQLDSKHEENKEHRESISNRCTITNTHVRGLSGKLVICDTFNDIPREFLHSIIIPLAQCGSVVLAFQCGISARDWYVLHPTPGMD
mgnify:FL=1